MREYVHNGDIAYAFPSAKMKARVGGLPLRRPAYFPFLNFAVSAQEKTLTSSHFTCGTILCTEYTSIPCRTPKSIQTSNSGDTVAQTSTASETQIRIHSGLL